MSEQRNTVSSVNSDGRRRGKRQLPKQYVGRNSIIAVMTIAFDVLVLILLGKASQYANIGADLFVKINIAALVLLAVINFISVLCIGFRRKWFYTAMIVLLCLCLGASSYGMYALSSMEKSLSNLTSTTITDDVNIVLLYNDKSSSNVITAEADLNGKKVGIISGTQLADAVKQRFEEEEIAPVYVECESYLEEARGLITGDLDCAALPDSWQSILAEEDSVNQYFDNFQTLSQFTTETTTVNSEGADKDLTSEPFTVLLEGDSDGLSDTIIIVTVNPQSMDITMTSIARDSYVPITCDGYAREKINSAHMYGGMGCMIDTINYMTDLDFDYYVEVNFQGIVSIVDALGGIQITNYVEFEGQTYTDAASFHDVEMPIGKDVTLNGEQALAWVRERHAFADGDFARQRHQQEFLKIILEKIMKTRDINTLLSLLNAAGDNLKTNLSVDQMTSFMSYAMTKAKRYYNTDSTSGIFHIRNWRITGYDDSVYNSSLDMNLYIYQVWPQAISDSYDVITSNLVTDASPETPQDISWDGEEGFEEDPVTYDYY